MTAIINFQMLFFTNKFYSLTISLVSCSLLFGWTMAIGQPTDKIQQGLSGSTTSVTVDEEGRLGLVTETYPAGCSAVLLTNVWVLTAGHCIDAEDGKIAEISATFSPGVTYNTNAMYKFGWHATDAFGLIDIGLLRLAQPVPINGSTSSFFTRLYRGSAVGKTVTIYGRSTGTYLKAEMTVKSSVDDGRNLQLESKQDTDTKVVEGDSGGPSFIDENGERYLVGLTSNTGGKIVAIAPHVNWITAATRSFLDQTQPFAASVALNEEISALPEGKLDEGNFMFPTANWARAQRKAHWMCKLRGFIGGTFLPGRDGKVWQYSFACIGRHGGKVLNASQADIDATSWGFYDLNTVPWPQASRAALAVCQSQIPGAVGGFFTGFMSKPPQNVEQQMSIVCMYGDSVKVSDVDAVASGELSDVDTTFWQSSGKLDMNNTTDWFNPQVDATEICQSYGFEGGFPTGHQVSNRRGVTCIGRKSLEFSGFTMDIPAAILKARRALYAMNLNEPLVAPENAAIDVQLTFKQCHAARSRSSGCPVTAAYQQWGYDPSTHRLRHLASGKCLNISGARRDTGAPIILYPCNGAANEKWTVIASSGSMEWTVKSDFNGLCLHALPSSNRSSETQMQFPIPATLVQMPCDKSEAQRFSSVDADWTRRNGPR